MEGADRSENQAGTVCIRTVSIQHNGARLLHAVDDRDGVYASNGTKIPGIRADAYGTGVGGHCVPHRPFRIRIWRFRCEGGDR